MKLQRFASALSFASLLALALLAPAAAADHERGDYDRGYDRGYDRVHGQVARLAYELDDAADHAAHLSRRSHGYHAVDAAFARLSDAAYDFRYAVESGDAYRSERAFERVAARYYDLRGEFRHFHGPDHVRAAFHRINTPMEDLYRIYTGRDLYRDDPHARHRVERRAPRHDDRHHDRRGRGRGRGRGHGRH